MILVKLIEKFDPEYFVDGRILLLKSCCYSNNVKKLLTSNDFLPIGCKGYIFYFAMHINGIGEPDDGVYNSEYFFVDKNGQILSDKKLLTMLDKNDFDQAST